MAFQSPVNIEGCIISLAATVTSIISFLSWSGQIKFSMCQNDHMQERSKKHIKGTKIVWCDWSILFNSTHFRCRKHKTNFNIYVHILHSNIWDKMLVNFPSDMCSQRILTSAYAFAHCDLNFHSAHFMMQRFFMPPINTDQTVRMRMLIWVFVWRTCQMKMGLYVKKNVLSFNVAAYFHLRIKNKAYWIVSLHHCLWNVQILKRNAEVMCHSIRFSILETWKYRHIKAPCFFSCFFLIILSSNGQYLVLV